jgi:hypothetical protein
MGVIGWWDAKPLRCFVCGSGECGGHYRQSSEARITINVTIGESSANPNCGFPLACLSSRVLMQSTEEMA